MADKTLFSSATASLPRANSINEAGGRAYELAPKHALAQIAATGTFNGVYYTSAQSQLDQVRSLIDQIDENVFLAKLAVYARNRAYMKDMPAALLVSLSIRDRELTHRIFDRVVGNGRVLRTVFQMVRSGQFGRKSLSSSLQRAFQRWLNEASAGKLLSASIGHDPSLRDVLRLARPTPKDNQRRALFGWLTGKEVRQWAPATESDLPREVKALIEYRNASTEQEQVRIVADVSLRWDLLADAALGPSVWAAIARQMGPQALRMNLNTLMRHGVFNEPGSSIASRFAMAMGFVDGKESIIELVAEKLANVDAIIRSKQFPYQFMAAYLNANEVVPHKIKSALHRAAEVACGNIPQLPGPVVIGVDTSGSMNMPVTGSRGRGATSKMRCVDVAALFASAILRSNPDSVVIPFDTAAYDVSVFASDSILSLATRLAAYGGGGTDCSLPLRAANSKHSDRQFAGAIIVSDNQSWYGAGRHGSTAMMTEWEHFVKNQRQLSGNAAKPKLICIDVQPYGTTQAPERDDILNIGGFSDAVFNVAASFLSDDASRLVREVEAVEL